MNNLPTILSICANVALALIVYSLKTTIRNAILELQVKLTQEFATKVELIATEDRLKEQIGLRDEIRAIPGMLSARGNDDSRSWPARNV